MDEDIVNEPPVEYTLDKPPSYYPAHGIWFNDEDVSIRKTTKLSVADEEDLRELEGELEDSENGGGRVRSNTGSAKKE